MSLLFKFAVLDHAENSLKFANYGHDRKKATRPGFKKNYLNI